MAASGGMVLPRTGPTVPRQRRSLYQALSSWDHTDKSHKICRRALRAGKDHLDTGVLHI